VRHPFLQLSGLQERLSHESVTGRVPRIYGRSAHANCISHTPSFSRRVLPEFFDDFFALRKSEGAGKVGSWPLPWPACNKNAGGRYHRFGRDIPTFPARWCYDLYALFPGTGCLAPVASEFVIRLLGISTGMPEPRDFTVAPDRSSARETRAAIRHAHRIPHPTYVTTAKRPLVRTGCTDKITISEKWKSEYFCRTGWTR